MIQPRISILTMFWFPSVEARPPGGDFPRGLIREYLAVDPTEKIATRWAKIKSSK